MELGQVPAGKPPQRKASEHAVCPACAAVRHRDSFSISQWRLGALKGRCAGCVAAKNFTAGAAAKVQCVQCETVKAEGDFSKTQWRAATEKRLQAKCFSCVDAEDAARHAKVAQAAADAADAADVAVCAMTKGRWNEVSYEDVKAGNLPDAPGCFRIRASRDTPAVYVGLAGKSLKAEILSEQTRLVDKKDPNSGFKMMPGEFAQYKLYPSDMTRDQARAYEQFDAEKQYKKGGCQRNAKVNKGRPDERLRKLGQMKTPEARFCPTGKAKAKQMQEEKTGGGRAPNRPPPPMMECIVCSTAKPQASYSKSQWALQAKGTCLDCALKAKAAKQAAAKKAAAEAAAA